MVECVDTDYFSLQDDENYILIGWAELPSIIKSIPMAKIFVKYYPSILQTNPPPG